jgi:peptide deformylase
MIDFLPATHPLLHKVAQLVEPHYFENDGAIIKPITALCIQMMQETNSYSISAQQIGIDLSLFVMNEDGNIKICCNPSIVGATADSVKITETCDTFEDLVLSVVRPEGVIARYLNIEGIEVTEKLEGLSARLWLHEYDHTQGICFTDRVGKMSLDIAKRKLKKSIKKESK